MNIIYLFVFILITGACFGQNNIKKAYALFASANTRLKIIKAHIDSARIQESIAEYSEAIKLYPQFSQAYRNRGRWYGRTGQHRLAVNDITLAIKYDSVDYNGLHAMRANDYYELKLYDSAIADWDIVIATGANMAYALLGKAKAEFMLGRKDSACADYKKAILLDGSLAAKKEFFICD